MKIKKETENEESQLETLCPYAPVCAESGYGNREICSGDFEICGKYFLFEGRNTIIEKFPLGIHHEENKPCLEKNCGSYRLDGIKKFPK